MLECGDVPVDDCPADLETRRPPPPLVYSSTVDDLWHFVAVVNLLLGLWYLWWRWTASLNIAALWFALPLVAAETFAYGGVILFTFNLWRTSDVAAQPPPAVAGDCGEADGPRLRLSVDVFIATYTEEVALVRRSIRDARALTYPFPIDVHIFVLDDGQREAMRDLAAAEGVAYLTRSTNVGFKAGNLRNAMEQTSGDFIVICDADTRLFPGFLANTLGYFRDPDVAFVQTPHWFYDLPEGERLTTAWRRVAGPAGGWAGRLIEAVFGEVRVGADPFVNDPRLFFDVIQRRRNWANAAFCCGAASIHRREAVMFVAISEFATAVSEIAAARPLLQRITRRRRSAEMIEVKRWTAAQNTEFTPYKFHVSEDIYSSILLHQDTTRRWKSVLHPQIEARMLSPQDLLSWSMQRFKYAGGSLDIFLHDNPIVQPGMTVAQKLMYLATFFSYLGALWNVVFLLSPIIYFVTAISPVVTYSDTFLIHAVPFLISNELAFLMGAWGLSDYRSKMVYLASFPISLGALVTVLRRRPIHFPVTPKTRQEGRHWRLIWPQLLVIALTLIALAIGLTRFAAGAAGYAVSSVIINSLWSLGNLMALGMMVAAARWRPPVATQ